MKKRKIGFNLVDLLIIAVLALAAFVVLYVFVLSDRGTQTTETAYRTIQYTLEITKVDSKYRDAVSVGDLVEDAIERRKIGTVVGVEALDYQETTFDYNSGEEHTATVEDLCTVKIVVEADAVDTERAYTVNGCDIRVGTQYSVMMPGLYGVAFCTQISDGIVGMG